MQNDPAKTLLSHKASLESLFDKLPALIYCKDTQGRIVCVNDALAASFHMTKADFEGKFTTDFPPQATGQLLADDANIIRTGNAEENMFLPYETPDGQRWAYAYKFPFRDMDGTIIGIIGFAMDVTELKRMQTELKRNEEKYRNFFETTKDCVYITTLDGTILEFNNAALEMFGYESKEQLKAVPVQDLYKDPQDRKRLQEKIARDGMVDKLPIVMRRKNDQLMHVQITALPLKDDNGDIYGYQGTIHDITALEKVEAQQKMLEAELRQAQKMEAVAKLSGGIAHDFNNLLFTIMGSIEMSQSFTGKEQGKQLDRAYRACLEAKQLIRRFLELSENAPATNSQGSIVELIQRATDSRVALSDRIYYEIQIEGGLYRVAFVYDQLLQALENLLSNAENALTDEGTIKVAAENVELNETLLDLGKSLAPGKYVKISVSDNGVGIPKDKLDKIFDPYFSTHKQPSNKGQGLGLTTVYATVKRHKGDIRVDSEPGKGTTFSIYLPAV